MNKTSIKIIKRKDVRTAANIKARSRVTRTATAFGEKKIERNLHRKMVDTVSKWIAESRENLRAEEVSAVRRVFGSDSLFMGKQLV